ncbi:unnamed protein product [Orchesella dallaii]|uniref:Uncharacterized protein n=1 Tax=Orchesella dallaii TaxID=48710 RepID=A0ABP1Q4M6_9HEXA
MELHYVFEVTMWIFTCFLRFDVSVNGTQGLPFFEMTIVYRYQVRWPRRLIDGLAFVYRRYATTEQREAAALTDRVPRYVNRLRLRTIAITLWFIALALAFVRFNGWQGQDAEPAQPRIAGLV